MSLLKSCRLLFISLVLLGCSEHSTKQPNATLTPVPSLPVTPAPVAKLVALNETSAMLLEGKYKDNVPLSEFIASINLEAVKKLASPISPTKVYFGEAVVPGDQVPLLFFDLDGFLWCGTLGCNMFVYRPDGTEVGCLIGPGKHYVLVGKTVTVIICGDGRTWDYDPGSKKFIEGSLNKPNDHNCVKGS